MATKEVAVRKRALIDKASRNMFMFVAAASVILGVTLVGVIYLTKKIAFNGKIIGEKSQIITAYDKSLSNLKSLGANIKALETNENLEVVARTREVICDILENNTPAEGDDDDDTEIDTLGILQGIGSIRECSALRVIPDALPATRNPEALLASLNKIFIISGTSPESLSPSDSTFDTSVPDVGLIPINLSISGDSSLTNTVLNNIEKSIRTFEMGTVTIEWRGTNSVLLRGLATAFYSADKAAELKTKTVCAQQPCRGGPGR